MGVMTFDVSFSNMLILGPSRGVNLPKRADSLAVQGLCQATASDCFTKVYSPL